MLQSSCVGLRWLQQTFPGAYWCKSWWSWGRPLPGTGGQRASDRLCQQGFDTIWEELPGSQTGVPGIEMGSNWQVSQLSVWKSVYGLHWQQPLWCMCSPRPNWMLWVIIGLRPFLVTILILYTDQAPTTQMLMPCLASHGHRSFRKLTLDQLTRPCVTRLALTIPQLSPMGLMMRLCQMISKLLSLWGPLTGLRSRQQIQQLQLLSSVFQMDNHGLLDLAVFQIWDLCWEKRPVSESGMVSCTGKGSLETRNPLSKSFSWSFHHSAESRLWSWCTTRLVRERTLSLLRPKCFCPRMTTDVAAHIQDCPRCLCRKHPIDQVAPLENFHTTQPMELVCIDYLALESSKGGYESILVVTDHFTKNSQAYPTKNQTARTTVQVLFNNFFSHYGFPTRLHSDQGRGKTLKAKSLKSSVFLVGLTRVAPHRTTPWEMASVSASIEPYWKC